MTIKQSFCCDIMPLFYGTVLKILTALFLNHKLFLNALTNLLIRKFSSPS